MIIPHKKVWHGRLTHSFGMKISVNQGCALSRTIIHLALRDINWSHHGLRSWIGHRRKDGRRISACDNTWRLRQGISAVVNSRAYCLALHRAAHADYEFQRSSIRNFFSEFAWCLHKLLHDDRWPFCGTDRNVHVFIRDRHSFVETIEAWRKRWTDENKKTTKNTEPKPIHITPNESVVVSSKKDAKRNSIYHRLAVHRIDVPHNTLVDEWFRCTETFTFNPNRKNSLRNAIAIQNNWRYFVRSGCVMLRKSPSNE